MNYDIITDYTAEYQPIQSMSNLNRWQQSMETGQSSTSPLIPKYSQVGTRLPTIKGC